MIESTFITSSCIISNNVVYKNAEQLFENTDADAQQFFTLMYQHFNLAYPKFYKMDNLSKLGWLASEILLKDTEVSETYKAEDVGIVLSNSNSSLDTDIKYFSTVSDIASPALFVYTLPNIVIGEICIRNKFKGENAFFVSDEFDAELIHKYVDGLFDNGILKACICGWVELLGEDYKAALFLVEKEGTETSSVFTQENIEAIYKA